MQQISFVIVPGLNDRKIAARWFYKWLSHHWSKRGGSTVVCQVNWGDGTDYQGKLNGLEQLISRQQQQGREVVLVGISAGATLAALAFAQGRARDLVTICGLLGLDPKHKQRQTSWFKALLASQQATGQLSAAQRRRILCLVPQRDHTINPAYAQLPGARVVVMKSMGHLLSIFIAAIGYRRLIWEFAQRSGEGSNRKLLVVRVYSPHSSVHVLDSYAML